MTSSYIFSKIVYQNGYPHLYDDIAGIAFYNLIDCARWDHTPEIGDIITFVTNDKKEGRLVAIRLNKMNVYIP